MLKTIQQQLEQAHVNCAYYEPTTEIPFDRILVLLGQDNQQREQIVEITAQEQSLNFENTSPASTPVYRIQFQLLFPFTVEDLATSQMASLLLFINRLLDFPGLELDELDNQIYYRYVWLTKKQKIDVALILSILGIIVLVLQLFTPAIEAIANGTSTFNELLEEIIKLNAK